MIIGGLNNVPDVKVLVLYILNYAGTPLSRDNIAKIGLESGTVEYFDIMQAMDEMLITGLIDILATDKPEILRITEMGRQTLVLFEKNLPYSVRRKNQAAFVKMLADIERESEVKAEIEKNGEGYDVICTLYEGEDILFQYRLFVPTQIQAQMIADQFKTDPVDKYRNILGFLINEKLFEEDNR